VRCGPKHLNITLTRAKLEQLVAGLVDKTEEPCCQALADAGLKAADIDEVILVEGQTRMPAVIEKVKKYLPRGWQVPLTFYLRRTIIK